MNRLDLERGCAHLFLLFALVQIGNRAGHQTAHRRFELLGVQGLGVFICEHLVVKLTKLAEIQRAGVVGVVVVHQRVDVLVEVFPRQFHANLLQHVVQLGYLQAPRLVRVELLKRGVHLEELLLFLPSLFAALDSLDLDRRRGQLLLFRELFRLFRVQVGEGPRDNLAARALNLSRVLRLELLGREAFQPKLFKLLVVQRAVAVGVELGHDLRRVRREVLFGNR